MTTLINASWIDRGGRWSLETFGPGRRTKGVLAHIRKELDEVAEDPTDITEWCDIILLAIDGARRAGADGQQIIDTLIDKQARNVLREWPDWRSMSEDEPIGHLSEGASA